MKGSQMYKEDISIPMQIKHKGENFGCTPFFPKQETRHWVRGSPLCATWAYSVISNLQGTGRAGTVQCIQNRHQLYVLCVLYW